MRMSTVLLFLVLAFASNSANAKSRTTHAMSMHVFKVITEANELVEEDKMDEAIAVIKEMQEKRRLSAYERAQSWYLLGSFYYKMEDEKTALEAFTKVMEAEGEIPIFLELNTLKTLVQLHMIQDQFEQARDYCLDLIAKTEIPTEADYTLLAQTEYRLENWESAIDAVLSGINAARAVNKIPKENLMVLQNATYFELKDYEKMVTTLKTLIKHYPKDTYLLYLSSIYGQLEQPEKQTVIMESLYENAFLMRGSQLSNLASLYMSVNVPYKAAKLLQDGIEEGRLEATERHYEMLSQAWRLAAETQNAIFALHEAAKLSDDGNFYLQKAYLQYDMIQWKEASQTVMLALDKGLKDDREGEAWLLKGMSLFNLNEFDDAIDACKRASNYKESRDLAQQWITYISSEQDKWDSLKAMN